jgi:RNA polymerase sigma factor (sigma-70 family)
MAESSWFNNPWDSRAETYERLANRMIAKDASAFETFSDEFGPRFRALFLKKGLPVADAEELAISCVSDIAMAVGQYRRHTTGGGFEAWVFTIARHRLVDWWRDHKNKPLPLRDEIADCLETNSLNKNSGLTVAVRECVTKLAPDDQKIIHLRYTASETFLLVAEMMEISEGAARVRLTRALKKLRLILEEHPVIRSFLATRVKAVQAEKRMIFGRMVNAKSARKPATLKMCVDHSSHQEQSGFQGSRLLWQLTNDREDDLDG